MHHVIAPCPQCHSDLLGCAAVPTGRLTDVTPVPSYAE